VSGICLSFERLLPPQGRLLSYIFAFKNGLIVCHPEALNVQKVFRFPFGLWDRMKH
jgi:hypothetical protein